MYIDEEKKIFKAVVTYKKKWNDNFLTFLNLKQDKDNFIFNDDKESLWIPFVEESLSQEVDHKPVLIIHNQPYFEILVQLSYFKGERPINSAPSKAALSLPKSFIFTLSKIHCCTFLCKFAPLRRGPRPTITSPLLDYAFGTTGHLKTYAYINLYKIFLFSIF